MELKNKRILITQPMLYAYMGSVVIAIETAEYLRKCGASVDLYTYVLAEPIRTELVKRGIPVFTADSDPHLDLFAYDIVWIHSQTLPESMVRQLPQASGNWEKAPYFLFLHMSSADFAPDEFPWIYQFEDTVADKILYISEKVESTHRDLLEEKIPFAYFRNPAPIEYLAEKTAGKLGRVLIVSNHVPAELMDAAQILRSEGIRVDFLGQTTHNCRLIQPADVQHYDSVITIGKTVPYCILSQTPVYVYDRFGGPGYLCEENYEQAKEWHFSGRGFGRKTSREIAQEIRANWNMACEAIKRIREKDSEQYRLDTVLEQLLGDLAKREKKSISPAQAGALFYAQRFAMYRFRYSSEVFDGSSRKSEYIRAMERSPSMRVGKMITYLPRRCREAIRGIKGAVKRRSRTKRICLVTCVYNEERNLPDYLRHIEPYVDDIVMLDDGSTDRSKEILRSSPKLRFLIERPEKEVIGDWDETTNHEELLKKVKELGADWVLALDPDERLEEGFLHRLRELVETSSDDIVYGLRLRALWGSYDRYRVDDLWGNRIQYRLFPVKGEITYLINRQKLHYRWYPDCLLGHERILDYDLFHLKTIMPEARARRAALYNSLDPQKQYQSIGYDFMTDEHGLVLEKIRPGHAYDYNTLPSYILEDLSAENGE